ncbi:hypothetical protein [Chitinophaga sp. XS-30]|uniref:hypothetical protein n=1 Tax=Chitinophaga sp. XS-30 TaxID=2604421 RepID=UPI0011DE0BD8|nr:hypothetical protein [Chitinophaga sp. XS-30]QEH39724.1 hypothetical protein FW415_02135 [Chitinophaga sp. XS-30]
MRINMLLGLLAVLLFSGSIAFASTYLNSTAGLSLSTDTGTDPDDTGTDVEAKKYWKNAGPTLCTYTVWVPKPGGGMEPVDLTGIEDICVKTKEVDKCTEIDCGPPATDTGF